MIFVRSVMVAVLIVNTTAIRIAYTCTRSAGPGDLAAESEVR
jgi:hypothetical protein